MAQSIDELWDTQATISRSAVCCDFRPRIRVDSKAADAAAAPLPVVSSPSSAAASVPKANASVAAATPKTPVAAAPPVESSPPPAASAPKPPAAAAAKPPPPQAPNAAAAPNSAAAAAPKGPPPPKPIPPPPKMSSWEDVAAALELPAPPTALQKARLTFAATIAHGLSLLRGIPQQMPRTVVWIVGARELTEGEAVRNGHLAEPLAKLCPFLGRLELWLIGPEMRDWRLELGGPSKLGGAAIVVRALSGTLHAVNAAGNSSQWPNYVVLFNSGLGSLSWPLVDGWLPSLTQLIQLNVPLLLSCYNEQEAVGQAALLKEAFDANVTVGARDNPLAHVAPSKPELNVHAKAADEAAEAVAARAAAHAAALDEAATAEAQTARERAAKKQPLRPSVADPFALPLTAAASAYDASIAQQLITLLEGGQRPVPAMLVQAQQQAQQQQQQQAAPPTAPSVAPSAAVPLAAAAQEVDPMLLFCGRSNRVVMWVQGTSMRSRLQSAIQRGRAFLRSATVRLAPQNLPGWLEGLERADEASAEELSWHCSLLAISTEERGIALQAHDAGALPKLREVLRSYGGEEKDSAGAAKRMATLSYAGMPPMHRILSGCAAAILNIENALIGVPNIY